MLIDKSWLRMAGPTILMGLVLLATSTVAAVYLRLEQTRTADVLREDVGSRRIAHDLETTIENLLTLLRDGSTQVDGLNENIRTLLAAASAHADKAEEVMLVGRLTVSFESYEQRWQEQMRRNATIGEQDVQLAMQTLSTKILPVCRQLNAFNSRQIELAEEAHAATVTWMSWGLVAVGGVAALAGLFLGYGVTRGLRRSIYQLSVRIRDAADRLGPNLPMVTLSRHSDFPQLHAQMETLIKDIEATVRELQQREREVLRADQLKAVGQLAAGAAHELRNPLTAIKMLIQANREDADQNQLPSEDLEIIEGEVRRMERCLHTFLDFARPPQPTLEKLDLSNVVTKVFALLAGRARHQRVTLQCDPPGEPLLLEADPEQVQQVLVNLVLNSLDALPNGGEVRVRMSQPHRGVVAVRVCDTGPGIPAHLMPRLFEPFVSSKDTGLGLGLVVSRRIAEAHGGNLQAANRSEGGACFELRLPVARASDCRVSATAFAT